MMIRTDNTGPNCVRSRTAATNQFDVSNYNRSNPQVASFELDQGSRTRSGAILNLNFLKGLQGVKADDFIVTKRPRLGSTNKQRKVEFADYERRLATMQSSIQAIQQAYLGTRERAVVVLEGWDTAGKGGIVRRLGWALDPRSFKVHPIAAPSSQEKGKHYLQRFWEKLPEQGQIVVFDRSWYGRVLVERVEGFATKREWRRAYEEINQFERLLVKDGIRIVKIFLDISQGEQIRRFKDRVTDPLKRWKLSYEDFRNRERWADYELAIEDMMDETSNKLAPWYLVPANDKPFGRLAAFTILIARLGKGVSLEPRPLDPKIAELAARLFDLS
jgi:AMP-polyphosphate phosphotransferase